MFEKKDRIKVLIIGADGVSRKYWVNYDEEFYDKKFKIDQDAVYQSEDKSWGRTKIVPTIMFRHNSVMPISYKVKSTVPDPDEMGMSIARAAWAIAELMRRRDEAFKTIITLLLIAACILGGASTYFGYDNGQKLVKIQDKLNQTYSGGSGSGSPTVYPIVNPGGGGQPIVVVPTVNPTPQPTPMPQISIT